MRTLTYTEGPSSASGAAKPRRGVGFALVALALAVLAPRDAEAGSPYLVVPAPSEAERSPAFQYANMTDAEALAELDRRNILYSPVDPIGSVRTPIRLTGLLHGVHFHSSLPPEERTDTPFEILDARLALALDDFAALLARHDIVEVVHYTMYRPNGPHPDVASEKAPAAGATQKGAGAGSKATSKAASKPAAGKAPPPKAPAAKPKAPGATPAPKAPDQKAAPPRKKAKKPAKHGAVWLEDGPTKLAASFACDHHAPLAKKGPTGKAGPGKSGQRRPKSSGKTAHVAHVGKRTGPPPKSPSWAPPGTRHPGGLAIDVGGLRKRDGTWLSVASDFKGKVGNQTCGAGAPHPESGPAQELRAIVCEALDLGIFTYVLTPNFDAAHVDHFHMEIKPEVRWFLYH